MPQPLLKAAAPSVAEAGTVASWKVVLPAGFVLLALLALLFTPFWVQQRVRASREDIAQAAEPARTLITEAQFLLARQTATLRGFYISGDEASVRQYAALVVKEDSVYRELGPLVSRLGPTVVAGFADLRANSAEWHARLDEDELRPRRALPPGGATDLPFEQTLYLDALEAARRLDEAVMAAARDRRRQIEAAEQEGRQITVALALLAVASALVVAYLGNRVQQLAFVAASRRREAERALEAKARMIEARSRLLRGITHDVKNPLGAADGYAELLELGLRGPLTDPQADYVAKIRRSIHAALDIIRDLLDLASVQTGALHVERVPADLCALAREAAEDHRGAVEAAGHRLALQLPLEPVMVDTDPARVRQILGNLLSNAVKYTPAPGTVGIAVAVVRNHEPLPTRAVIRVSDSGPGIPADQRDRIFDEFERLHSGAIQGHGLGLAISQRIAQLLGADLRVEDGDEGGAVFVLWLPFGTATAT